MSDSNRLVHDEAGRGYRAALLQAGGRVPDDQVDWDAFHARLASRAELALARLRNPRVAAQVSTRRRATRAGQQPVTVPWWAHAARWSRLVVAGSVAAGIALIIVVRTSPKETSDTVVATTAAGAEQTEKTRAVFESAAVGHGSAWSIDAALLPSATDLLVPLGKGGAPQ
jgi:hypothetical protein